MKQRTESDGRDRLVGARRIIIKLGTSVVTGEGGEVCCERVEPLVRSIAALQGEGRQLVLVSSGAVGLGAGRLGLSRARLRDLVTRQACAAVGQSLLMNAYERLFSVHKVKLAQVLLTEDDFTDRRRYRNLRQTMERLLKLGVLPVVNENDTVSTAELEYQGAGLIFSDNDRLAALVMSKLEADALILLSDVDGLLVHPPGKEPPDSTFDEGWSVLPLVNAVTPELRSLAAGASASGRGGMSSKIDAAQIAINAGGVAVIANGRKPDTLSGIFAGERVGTLFVSDSRMHGKRRWIAYAASVRGRVIVNAGAQAAIVSGKASLLASGVVRVEGNFEPQEVVSISDHEGREFARGIANCASTEAATLIAAVEENSASGAGRTQKSSVLVTRDNIVILESLSDGSRQPSPVETDG